MMTTRFIIGVPLAAAITFFLFIFMRDLVKFDEEVIPVDPTPTVVIVMGREVSDTDTAEDDTDSIEEPEIDIDVDPINPPSADPTEGEDGPPIDWGGEDVKVVVGLEVCGQPQVRVNPTYPSQLASQGVEGYTIIGFVVTKEGRTKDVQVLEVEPPSAAAFGRAGVKAVKQWRYEPCVVNGKVSEVRLMVQLVFELAE